MNKSSAFSTETILDAISSSQALIHDQMRARIGDLEDYSFLQRSLLETDVSKDPTYRRTFNRFYKMRQKPASWYEFYFGLLERNKRRPDIDFDEVINDIYAHATEVHPSFASKMVATIDPHRPVYDNEVCKHLGIRKPSSADPAAKRLDIASRNYLHIRQFHREAQAAPASQALLTGFDSAFPQFRAFTQTKKLDIMLWLWRPVVTTDISDSPPAKGAPRLGADG